MTMATLVVRYIFKVMVAPMVWSGGVCVWWKSGVSRSVFVGAFGRNLASVAMKMFSHFTYVKKNVINFVLPM
jgi:hypothetical protein